KLRHAGHRVRVPLFRRPPRAYGQPGSTPAPRTTVSPGDAASMASCTGVPGPGVTTIVPACAREAEKMATKASTTRVDMGDAYLACISRVNAGLPPLTRAPPVRHHLASTR